MEKYILLEVGATGFMNNVDLKNKEMVPEVFIICQKLRDVVAMIYSPTHVCITNI